MSSPVLGGCNPAPIHTDPGAVDSSPEIESEPSGLEHLSATIAEEKINAMGQETPRLNGLSRCAGALTHGRRPIFDKPVRGCRSTSRPCRKRREHEKSPSPELRPRVTDLRLYGWIRTSDNPPSEGGALSSELRRDVAHGLGTGGWVPRPLP